MHVGNAHLNARRLLTAHAGYSCGLALLAFLFGSKALQNAVAEGDTRTITMHHIHTDEDITITFKREGRYDDEALAKLDWFLRDWRRGEKTHMDPRLVDLVWEVQREAGNNQPIQVVCGYRAPQTNEMLRHRSANSGVARFSQHMLGRAMDFYIAGVDLEHLREIGLRLQRGGVGFYPSSGAPFVHMDVGGIRMWPRMSREQLVRVFPDGRTVYLPNDGRPLPGFALALADVRKRGSEPSENLVEAARNAGMNVDVAAGSERAPFNPFAKLLRLAKHNDDEDDDAEPAVATAPANPPAAAPAPAAPKHPILAAVERDAQVAETATAKVASKIADAASKAKFIRTADAAAPSLPAGAVPAAAAPTAAAPAIAAPPAASPPAAPVIAAPAAPTPNQVIAGRGYWQGPQDGTFVAPQAANSQPRRTVAAARAADATGAIGKLAGARDDRPAPQLALAYAEQPDRNAAAGAAATPQPSGIAALRAAAIPTQSATLPAPAGAIIGTTIAVKREADQAASAVMTATASSVTVVKSGARLANPWLRAVVLSPSVHRFLTTMALGAGDLRWLAVQMVKPKSAVIMTFAADPNPGLAHDHFSGAAIVFISTVTYPTHTAALQ